MGFPEMGLLDIVYAIPLLQIIAIMFKFTFPPDMLDLQDKNSLPCP